MDVPRRAFISDCFDAALGQRLQQVVQRGLPPTDEDGRKTVPEHPPSALKKSLKLLATQFAIPKNLGQQSRPYGFPRMDWHHGRTTIGVLNEMVTAFDTQYCKARLFQGRQQFLAGQSGNSRHATIEIR